MPAAPTLDATFKVVNGGGDDEDPVTDASAIWNLYKAGTFDINDPVAGGLGASVDAGSVEQIVPLVGNGFAFANDIDVGSAYVLAPGVKLS